ANIPLITNADISHLFTLTPDNLVASRLLPIENIYLPIFVLFKTTAANIAKATITKISIGKLLLNLKIFLFKPLSFTLIVKVTLNKNQHRKVIAKSKNTFIKTIFSTS